LKGVIVSESYEAPKTRADLERVVSALENLEENAEAILELSEELGTGVRIELVDRGGSKSKFAGMFASYDGETVEIDPVALGKTIQAVGVERSKGKATGKNRRALIYRNGLTAMYEEELLHLVTMRLLKDHYDQSSYALTFPEYLRNVSDQILGDLDSRSRSVYRTSKARGQLYDMVKNVYGDSDYLGLEMLRMFMQMIRHQSGEAVFTEDFTNKNLREGESDYRTQLLKAFQNSNLLEEALTFIGDKQSESESVSVLGKVAGATLAWISDNKHRSSVKTGADPLAKMSKDLILVHDIFDGERAGLQKRASSLSPREQQAVEFWDSISQLGGGRGLTARVDNYLRTDGTDDPKIVEITHTLALRNIVSQVAKSVRESGSLSFTDHLLQEEPSEDGSFRPKIAVASAIRGALREAVEIVTRLEKEGKYSRKQDSVDQMKEATSREIPDESTDMAAVVETGSLEEASVEEEGGPELEVTPQATGATRTAAESLLTMAADYAETLEGESKRYFEEWLRSVDADDVESSRALVSSLQQASKDLSEQGQDGQILFEEGLRFFSQEKVKNTLRSGLAAAAPTPAEEAPLNDLADTATAQAFRMADEYNQHRAQQQAAVNASRQLGRLREYTNQKRKANGLPPVSLVSSEVVPYAGDVGLTEDEVVALQDIVLTERLAKRIALLADDVYENEMAEQLAESAGVGADHLSWARGRTARSRERLDKAVASASPEVLERSRETAREKTLEQSARVGYSVVNSRAFKELFGSDPGSYLKTTFDLEEGELEDLKNILSMELTEDSPPEDVVRFRRAEAKVGVMQHQYRVVYERNRAQLDAESKELHQQLDALLDTEYERLADVTIQQGEVEKFIRDSLKSGKATGTGSFFSPQQLDEMRETSVAFSKMVESLVTDEDGGPKRQVYDLIANPIGNPSDIRQVLSDIAATEGMSLSELSRMFGVSSDILVGAMQMASEDVSVADAINDAVEYLKSLKYLKRQRQIEKGAPSKDLARRGREALKEVRAERRTIFRNIERVSRRLSKADMLAGMINVIDSSPEMQALKRLLQDPPKVGNNGTFRMVESTSAGVNLVGFSAPGIVQEEINLVAQDDPTIWASKLAGYLKKANAYIEAFSEADEKLMSGEETRSLEAQGFDVRVMRGLVEAVTLDLPMMEDAYRELESDRTGKVPFGMSRFLSVGLFRTPEKAFKHLGTAGAKRIASAIMDSNRADNAITAARSRHSDFQKVLDSAMQSHGLKSDDVYREQVFDLMAVEARQFDSPVKAGYTLPNGRQVTKEDVTFLRKLESAYRDLASYSGPRRTRGVEEKASIRVKRQDGSESTRTATLSRKARPVGDYSVSRRKDIDKIRKFVDSVTGAYEGSTIAEILPMIREDNSPLEDFNGPMARVWDSNPAVLMSYMMDSRLPESDRKVLDKEFEKLKREWVSAMLRRGDYNNLVDSLTVDTLVNDMAQIPGVSMTADQIRRQLGKELKRTVVEAVSMFDRSSDDSSNVDLRITSVESVLTQRANKLDLPSALYQYGVVSLSERMQFFSAPRVIADTRLFNVIESALSEAKKLLRSSKLPAGVRNRAQFTRLLEAAEAELKNLKSIREKPSKLAKIDEDTVPAGLRTDLNSVLHTLVLAPVSVNAGNVVLASASFFVYMLNRGRAVAGILNALHAMVAVTTYAAAGVTRFAVTGVAKGFDKLFGKGVIAEKTINDYVTGMADSVLANYMGNLGSHLVTSHESLKELGLNTRDPLGDTVSTLKAEYRKSPSTTNGMAFVGKSVLAVLQKFGIDAGDRVVNQAALTLADQRLNEWQELATRYGQLFSRKNGSRPFSATDSSWQVRPDDIMGLDSETLVVLRQEADSLGQTLEQTLWNLYTHENLHQQGSRSLTDAAAPVHEKHRVIAAIMEDWKERLIVSIVEKVNKPTRFNRATLPKVNAAFAVAVPLLGYTSNLMTDIISAVQLKRNDADWLERFGALFVRMMFLSFAAAMSGIFSMTVREEIKRHIERRSSGVASMFDEQFWENLKRAKESASEGEYRRAYDNLDEVIAGASQALPYGSDLITVLLGLSGTGYNNRSGLLDISNRSLVLQFLFQSVRAVVNGFGREGKDGFVQELDGLANRWVPMYAAVSATLGSGDREKYLNTRALENEAVRSGIRDPRSRYQPSIVRSPKSVVIRRLMGAASDRDKAAVRAAFDDLVQVLIDDSATRGKGRKLSEYEARKKARKEVERQSPVYRAVGYRKQSRSDVRDLLESVSGRRSQRIPEAIEDYRFAAKTVGSELRPYQY
jgi:hypothetical protein